MEDRLAGILLGTAVGDSLGLPAEGLSRARLRRFFPGPWRHRFILGRGMTSDDTEHALFVAQSLLKNPDDAAAFQKSLAWKLRGWLLGLPAGVGFGTLRACIKLCLGFPPGKSGVYSAGNGPAMRTALIGAYFHDNAEAIRRFVRAATEITHTDPKAFTGALAVALLSAWAVRSKDDKPPEIETVIGILESTAKEDEEWRKIPGKIREAYTTGMPVEEFADSLELHKGITGYIYHTVPISIYAWLRHYGDFRATLESALNCGGDTDTVGAITGALAGAATGASGIPDSWLQGIWEWPRTVGFMRKIAERLACRIREGRALGQVFCWWPLIIPRNILFLILILLHGFRRLLPPY